MCNMQRHIVTSFTTTSRTLKPFAILDRLQGLYETHLNDKYYELITPHRKSRSCDPAIFRKFISWLQNRKIGWSSQNMPFSGQFPELDFCCLCITTI